MMHRVWVGVKGAGKGAGLCDEGFDLFRRAFHARFVAISLHHSALTPTLSLSLSLSLSVCVYRML
jgi:hypothetical protein